MHHPEGNEFYIRIKQRSVLLLLVEENVGNFLEDARRQAVLALYAWAAIPTSSSSGSLRPSSKVWQFSPRFSIIINGRLD